MAQLGNKTKYTRIFFRIADILIAVHFTLDPYIYVILRFKKIRTHKNSESTPNTRNRDMKLQYNQISQST